MVPKQGPKKGIQNLTTIKSGFSFLNSLPILNQLKGLMELIQTLIFKLAGAGSDESCVVPGNKKLGYCKLKV